MNILKYTRSKGREICMTDGSNHYKGNGQSLEPLELAMSQGYAEDFCIGSVVKYITRFRKTRNMQDLIKAADYVHILAGYEFSNNETYANARAREADDELSV